MSTIEAHDFGDYWIVYNSTELLVLHRCQKESVLKYPLAVLDKLYDKVLGRCPRCGAEMPEVVKAGVKACWFKIRMKM